MPISTLQDLIAQSGVDPLYFDEGGSGAFASDIGLKGKGLEGFEKFADIMPFDRNKIQDLLSSLGEFQTQQRGFVQEQFDIGSKSAQSGFGRGLESLRSGMFGQFTGARQQTGGFAGSGAQQRTMGLIGQAGQRQFGGLKTGLSERLERLTGAKERGFAGVDEQVSAREGQIQGLLGDYISRLTGLGSQFLALDPGQQGSKLENILGQVNIPGDGLSSTQEDRQAQQEGWPDADSKKRWMDAGAPSAGREQYGWQQPSGG